VNITDLAIRYSRVTLVSVLILVFAGISSYFALPKAQNPAFTVRTAVITTLFPGASPERVEQLVTDTIEEKILEMPELDSVTSESRTGISIVHANILESYTDMRPIFDNLRRKVDDVTGDLPDGVMPPQVNDEFGDTFGHVYMLTGDGYSPAEMKTIADEIRERLLRERNIAKVDIYGAQSETVFIEYNNARLTDIGLPPQQLAASLQSINILSSGGQIRVGPERIVLEPSGNFESIEDLKRTVIALPGTGELVFLGDIVNIYRGYEDPARTRVYSNGEQALALAVSMRKGGNILDLGRRLAELIPELEANYPLGITIEPLFQQSALTEASVDAFLGNLLQAVGIVILVMVLTLGFRTGIVVASLIPIVMVSTFFVMGLFDIGITQISLAALIIALGLLVDNAIVVVEATIVRREQGEEPVAACIAAAKEMLLPLLVSSLTTAAAFTPIALAQSAVSEFTSSIFYVVTIALLLSWLLSMTFVPMLTPVLLKVNVAPDHQKSTFTGRPYRVYRTLLLPSLRHPVIFGLIVIGAFAGALYGMGYVPKVFIPPSEDPVLSAKLELPAGTAIEATEVVINDVGGFLQNELLINAGEDENATGVTSWAAYIGTGGPRFVAGFDPPNPNAANTAMVINVNSPDAIDPMIAAIEDYTFEHHPDLQVQVKRLANGPPVSYPIEVRVSGPEFYQLFRLVSRIKQQIWSYDAVTAVKDTWGPQSKKLIIKINQARALRAGVSNNDIAVSLNASLSGMKMTEYRQGDDIIPITLRTVPGNRQDITRLDNLTIFSQSTGVAVPLKQVADVEVVWEPARIERRNRDRTITIQAQLRPDVTAAEITAIFGPWLAQFSQSWPREYIYEEGGETEKADEANASIVAALPFAGMGIVLLLMLQFNSLRRTGIVLITIPLGLIGVTIGLLVAKSTFGFFTFLGLVSLAGIVINNAIVLLDRIKTEIEENGLDPADAVVEACQQRARPILLTTATTVGGMFPLWMSGGPMFEPLAIAILFGLLFATFVTLLLVPVFYSSLFRVKYD